MLTFHNVSSQDREHRILPDIIHSFNQALRQYPRAIAVGVPKRLCGLGDKARLIREVPTADIFRTIRIGANCVGPIDVYIRDMDDLEWFPAGRDEFRWVGGCRFREGYVERCDWRRLCCDVC